MSLNGPCPARSEGGWWSIPGSGRLTAEGACHLGPVGSSDEVQVDSATGVVHMPQCEKCGEIYMDTSGQCPTCRARNRRNFTIAVVVLFAVAIVAAFVIRIILL